MSAIDEIKQLRIERDRWKQLHDALAELVQSQARRMDFMQKIIDGEFPEGCTPADAKMLREANHGLIAELEALHQERDGLLDDAARYRWLRSKNVGPSQIEKVSDDCNPPYFTLKCEGELDAAVDAAMAKEQGE